MGECKEYRLGDLFERVTRKNSNLESENVLTISAQHGLINQEEFFNKSVAGKNLKNSCLLKKGEFAYNKSYSAGYPMGATKMLEKYNEGVVSTLYICFKSKSNLVYNEYFKYFFESKEYYDELSKIAQEGARNHGLLNVSVNDYFNIKIKVPSLSEQKKLAKLLNNIEKIIRNCKLISNNTFKEKKYYFNKIVNEKSINRVMLKNIITFRNGYAFKGNEYITDGKYNVITISNVQGGKYIDINNRTQKVNSIPSKMLDYQILKENDLLVSLTGNIGRVSLNKGNNNLLNQRVGLLEVDEKNINKLYLYYYLSLSDFQLKMKKNGQGGAQKNISKNDICHYSIKLLNNDDAKKLINMLNVFDDIINIYERKIKEYDNLKIWLMKNVLTGKVKIKI